MIRKPSRRNIVNIAVDGPSGAGKSTLAKGIAAALGICYVDTGAIYRTLGLAAMRAGVDPSDPVPVAGLLRRVSVGIDFIDGKQINILDGEPVGDEIRTPAASDYSSRISALPDVRRFLLDLQRRTAKERSTVMDGRDIGTVILPDADVKIFLSAAPEERARRRFLELKEKGTECDFETVLADILARDERDSTRALAPLKPADDAVLLDNSDIGPEETVDAALKIIYEKVPRLARAAGKKL